MDTPSLNSLMEQFGSAVPEKISVLSLVIKSTAEAPVSVVIAVMTGVATK